MKPTVRLELPDSEKLHNTLTHAISEFLPEVVVETGTYLGTGSTRIIINAFDGSYPRIFYTIELSQSLHAEAVKNLADVPFVECLWGLSVERTAAIRATKENELLRTLDPNLDIFVDFLPDPIAGYLRELEGALGPQGQNRKPPPDRLLRMLLRRHRGERLLICLDSAGSLGWLEFTEVLRLQEGRPFLLMLDDINHVKHYRTRLAIESSPEWQVYGSDMTEGWMIARYHGRARKKSRFGLAGMLRRLITAGVE